MTVLGAVFVGFKIYVSMEERIECRLGRPFDAGITDMCYALSVEDLTRRDIRIFLRRHFCSHAAA